MTANWLSAFFQVRVGRVHFLEAFFKAKYKSLVAASSFGKCPLFLMIFLKDIFRLSMALVV